MPGTKIENSIDEIIRFLENESKPALMSKTKAIVPIDDLFAKLDDLKQLIPDEIRRYQKIIVNRDRIIEQAEQTAKQIVDEANAKAQQLVDQNEITQQAYAQANQLVSEASAKATELRSSAEHDAEQIRTGALCYTNDILGVVESIMSEAYNESKERSERLNSSLRVHLDELVKNKSEIVAQLNGEPMVSEPEEEEVYDNIPEDAFVKNAGIE